MRKPALTDDWAGGRPYGAVRSTVRNVKAYPPFRFCKHERLGDCGGPGHGGRQPPSPADLGGALGFLAVRIVLTVVFALAGLTKLADRTGTRRTLGDFGVAEPVASPAAVLVPVGELAVAAGLLFTGSARAGAAGALVLLAMFSAGITASLARGQRPDCHCFGQVRSTPIGPDTLVRNAVLAGAAAAVAAWGPGAGPGRITDWLGERSGGEAVGVSAGAVLFLLVVVEGWLIMQLTRQQGRLLLRLDALEGRGVQPGLPVGHEAPPFDLPTVTGDYRSLADLLDDTRPVLLVFTEPNCGPCRALLPEIGSWQADYHHLLRVAVISGGAAALDHGRVGDRHLTEVLLADTTTPAAYRINRTPAAVLIDRTARIASPVGVGADAIRRLVLRATSAVTTGPARTASPTASGNSQTTHPVSSIPAGQDQPRT